MKKNLEHIGHRMQRPSSIFELDAIGVDLTSILVEINSYKIFKNPDFDINLKAPKDSFNEEQKKSHEDANKEIISLK